MANRVNQNEAIKQSSNPRPSQSAFNKKLALMCNGNNHHIKMTQHLKDFHDFHDYLITLASMQSSEQELETLYEEYIDIQFNHHDVSVPFDAENYHALLAFIERVMDNEFSCTTRPRTDKVTIVGPCSKFVDGQGWTTVVTEEQLYQLGYVKKYVND